MIGPTTDRFRVMFAMSEQDTNFDVANTPIVDGCTNIAYSSQQPLNNSDTTSNGDEMWVECELDVGGVATIEVVPDTFEDKAHNRNQQHVMVQVRRGCAAGSVDNTQ